MIKYTNKLQIRPLLRNVATVSTNADVGNPTARVRLRNMQWLSFVVGWDYCEAATDTLRVTVWSSTNQASTNAADQALPFKYRLSSVDGVVSDAWGAITEVTAANRATGAEISGSTDFRLMLIDVDPAVIPAIDSNALYTYVRLVNESTSTTDIGNAWVIGVFEPRFPQNANLTST